MKYIKTITPSCAAALCMASLASAQTGLQFQVNGVVSPQNPTVTIDIYATYPVSQPIYGVVSIGYHVHASEAAFTNNIQHHYWIGWGSSLPPEPINHGDWLEGMGAGQIFGSNILVSSPILLHTIEWTTSDFTPRDILLSTDIVSPVYLQIYSVGPVVSVSNPINASGMIQVIPAPSSTLALLAGAGLVGVRRRR